MDRLWGSGAKEPGGSRVFTRLVRREPLAYSEAPAMGTEPTDESEATGRTEAFSNLLDEAGVGLATFRLGDSNCLFANTTFGQIFGYTSSASCSNEFSPERHFLPEDMAAFLEALSSQAKTYRDIPAQSLKGEHLVIRLSALVRSDTEVVEVVVLDRTAEQIAVRGLRESEGRFRDLFDFLPVAIAETDGRGRFILVNPKGVELLGYDSEEELLGKSVAEMVVEEDRATLVSNIAKRLAGDQRTGFTYKMMRKDGSIFESEVHSTRIMKNGEPGGMRAAVLDVTARNQAERDRRLFDQKMLHTQKLESLGVMAGGIAHDFNNLLTAVLGNAQLALHDLLGAADVRNYLEQIEIAATRAAGLTSQLLSYAGNSLMQSQSIDLNGLLEEMAPLVEVSTSKKVSISLDLEPGLPAIHGDPSQIRQVVLNLLTNASEALGIESGQVVVKSQCVDADAAYLSGSFIEDVLPEGTYVSLQITDNGRGMEQDTIDRIFDPFFTTNFIGRGLGLTAVLGIVRAHKGAVKVASRPGHGTTFELLFPPHGRPVQEEAVATPLRIRFDGAVALLADDETAVLEVTKRMLERVGFRVITAVDGAQAVARFQAEADSIDVVLLDYAMPKLDGGQALEKIMSIRSDIPVIVCSGYSNSDALGHDGLRQAAGFLRKPSTMSQLIEALDEVISAEPDHT